jgi:hypothetical protein
MIGAIRAVSCLRRTKLTVGAVVVALSAATATARPPVNCGPGYVLHDGQLVEAPQRPQGDKLPECKRTHQ